MKFVLGYLPKWAQPLSKKVNIYNMLGIVKPFEQFCCNSTTKTKKTHEKLFGKTSYNY